MYQSSRRERSAASLAGRESCPSLAYIKDEISLVLELIVEKRIIFLNLYLMHRKYKEL